MSDKEVAPHIEVKVRKPYKQDKSPEQVKREIVAFQHRINAHVRDKYMQDAKPVFVDKG
jgi:hypothetical protein